MHGKMVHNSCGTGKTWFFEDLGRISDWREALGTVFRENVGTQIYPFLGQQLFYYCALSARIKLVEH